MKSYHFPSKKGFTLYKSVTKHPVQVHTEDHLKPFHCKICDKGFAKQYQLDTHMNIHTGSKPYKCEYCDKAFSDNGNKAMHEKSVHEGFRRHGKLCQINPESCTHKKSLSLNVRRTSTHIKQKLPCMQCDKVFPNDSRLKNHVKKVHEKIPELL